MKCIFVKKKLYEEMSYNLVLLVCFHLQYNVGTVPIKLEKKIKQRNNRKRYHGDNKS